CSRRDTVSPGMTKMEKMLQIWPRRTSLELYSIIEACSPGPYLELFARFQRSDWDQWGNEDVEINSFHGVASRKAHCDPQMRLFDSPRGYGEKKTK
ncbi:MAG TPA: hypothetical protein PK875_10125, partial [Spirochaetota bacterium]|nr:hypothetical protein [Spirochaetota bacterium]